MKSVIFVVKKCTHIVSQQTQDKNYVLIANKPNIYIFEKFVRNAWKALLVVSANNNRRSRRSTITRGSLYSRRIIAHKSNSDIEYIATEGRKRPAAFALPKARVPAPPLIGNSRREGSESCELRAALISALMRTAIGLCRTGWINRRGVLRAVNICNQLILPRKLLRPLLFSSSSSSSSSLCSFESRRWWAAGNRILRSFIPATSFARRQANRPFLRN